MWCFFKKNFNSYHTVILKFYTIWNCKFFSIRIECYRVRSNYRRPVSALRTDCDRIQRQSLLLGIDTRIRRRAYAFDYCFVIALGLRSEVFAVAFKGPDKIYISGIVGKYHNICGLNNVVNTEITYSTGSAKLDHPWVVCVRVCTQYMYIYTACTNKNYVGITDAIRYSFDCIYTCINNSCNYI